MGFDTDMAIDTDLGIDTDMGIDTDLGIDMDMSIDTDMGIDADMGNDMDAGIDMDTDMRTQHVHITSQNLARTFVMRPRACAFMSAIPDVSGLSEGYAYQPADAYARASSDSERMP